MGDFGLATRHRDIKDSAVEETTHQSELQAVYQGLDDISEMLGSPATSVARVTDRSAAVEEAMTGGVGTTFYRAPEQEGRLGDGSPYTFKADLFSFGIILFEIFHPPFETYMERAETLTTLRCDHEPQAKTTTPPSGWLKASDADFAVRANNRFPSSFTSSVSTNAQRYGCSGNTEFLVFKHSISSSFCCATG